MTIQSTQAFSQAISTGVPIHYNIPFPLYSQTHLTVLKVTNNVPTIAALGTDYTFTTWNPDNKGQVQNPVILFSIQPPGGTLLVFLLTPPGTQLTSITNQNAFFPATIEMEYDLEAQFPLKLNEWAMKSIKAPDWEYSGNGVNLTLPPIALRASGLLGFDSAGNIVIYPQTTTTSGVPIYPASTQSALPTPAVPGSPAMGYTSDTHQYFGWDVTDQVWQGFV